MRLRLAPMLALACLVSVAFPAGAADRPHGMFTPSDIKWGDAPPTVPKGAKLAVLYGDPGKDGLFVVRAKLPANYRIPAHSHPTDEVVTVLSGTLFVGMGDKLAPASVQPFPRREPGRDARQDEPLRADQAADRDRGHGDGTAPVHLREPGGRPEQEVAGD